MLLNPICSATSANYCGSIGKSDDEVGRMLEVLRFWFTKDLVRPAIYRPCSYPTVLMEVGQKYVKGKPCKPYNSALGEFFRVSPGLIGVRWALLTYADSATG